MAQIEFKETVECARVNTGGEDEVEEEDTEEELNISEEDRFDNYIQGSASCDEAMTPRVFGRSQSDTVEAYNGF